MSTPNMPLTPQPLLRRVAETSRPAVPFVLDGQPTTALEGDTVLTAILTQHPRLRHNEFSQEPRAGFCMMGACQDCWVQTDSGERLRACSTFIRAGMALHTGTASAADGAST
ncbi:MAG: (2Fe-2S)-binding protein [Hydrogenophaga sp.]|nr:(2Fe-2S)-binding protein [Hydrogenophaga sp.]